MTPMERYEQNKKAFGLEHAIYAMVDRITQAERGYATCASDEMDKWYRIIDRRHNAMRRLVVALRRMPAVDL